MVAIITKFPAATLVERAGQLKIALSIVNGHLALSGPVTDKAREVLMQQEQDVLAYIEKDCCGVCGQHAPGNINDGLCSQCLLPPLCISCFDQSVEQVASGFDEGTQFFYCAAHMPAKKPAPRKSGYSANCAAMVDHPGEPSWYKDSQHSCAYEAFHRGARDPLGNHWWCGHCLERAELVTLGSKTGYPDLSEFGLHLGQSVKGPDAWLEFAKTEAYVLIGQVAKAVRMNRRPEHRPGKVSVEGRPAAWKERLVAMQNRKNGWQ